MEALSSHLCDVLPIEGGGKESEGTSISNPASAWFFVSRGWGCLCRSHPALTCYDPLVFFFMYIFIGVQLLYTVVLVSALQQCESALSLHIVSSHPPPTPLTPLRHRSAPSWAPGAVRQLLPSCLFDAWSCIHVSAALSVHPPFPSRLVPTCPFSTPASLFVPCKSVHVYHFSRYHTYVLICAIYFSLSDLLDSVWHTLGLSTSLQKWLFSFEIQTKQCCLSLETLPMASDGKSIEVYKI